MDVRRCLEIVVLSALGVAPAQAQAPRDRLLITPEALAERMRAPNLVLLHVGEAETYAGEHIPGARHVTLRTLSAPQASRDELSLQMPDAAALESALEQLGISDDSEIVVYMADEWLTPAARVLYTLDYAGLGERTRLLEGGLPAWKGSGGTVTDAVPAPRTGRLSPLEVRANLVVDRAFMQSHLDSDGFAIIDARAQAVYDGVQADRGRYGHIPGAGSVFWGTLYDQNGLLRPDEELRTIFARAGVQPGDVVVGYCHIGQYATAMLFAARVLGFDVRLYDGSFQEWGGDPASPLELPKGTRP